MIEKEKETVENKKGTVKKFKKVSVKEFAKDKTIEELKKYLEYLGNMIEERERKKDFESISKAE